MKQQEQKRVLDEFRAYAFNTLVATSIGEEGLDIPDVDLIVCLDVSSSPTRSVQREGRTGRHRAGRVVHLLSEGKEVQDYETSVRVRSLSLRCGSACFWCLEVHDLRCYLAHRGVADVRGAGEEATGAAAQAARV